jgi:putative DNA primase/helicase
MLVTAPAVSGAGSGKGLLVRAICTIAFGIRPRAFTTGSERQELDKRLARSRTQSISK